MPNFKFFVSQIFQLGLFLFKRSYITLRSLWLKHIYVEHTVYTQKTNSIEGLALEPSWISSEIYTDTQHML